MKTAILQDERSHAERQCSTMPTPGESQDAAPSLSGASLFQDCFFFCKIKNVGDVPGIGSIYVETVVDPDSGAAFAKVYSARSALNAVDILSSRVVPFLENHGITIQSIYTRLAREYCGLPPAHPYETFLASNSIQHLHINKSTAPRNGLCEHFFSALVNDFFLPALRKKFHVSMDELQKHLDNFLEARNVQQISQAAGPKSNPAND